ncbi:Uncharacterised protein [Acetobacterium wieringae]|uniref:helix-turn-helix domain-containing protein n=1 Tax=Acetobacterium wieringae TaxID=52694 RepID=UPI001D5C148F|nr:helix-turn-helix domain-containing protein [Acetobacterium wieringae]VUZ26580.1 Uncharacterised protein [Acetobacterium wieringae]
MEKLTYTVKEAADLIGISQPKMYEMVKIEGFPVIKIGRAIRIPKVEFKDWLSREATRGTNGNQLQQ